MQNKLNTGAAMPMLGLGTFLAEETQCYDSVLTALNAGYRHIDTAQVYRNEAQVGQAIKDSGIPREEIFITTKLSPRLPGYDNARHELIESLNRLQTDYVDLYLIHWPSQTPGMNKETWRAFEELHFEGKAKAIGVSNFLIHHLNELMQYANVKPAANQVELHPYLTQYQLQAYCDQNEIALISYGPFMKGEAFGIEALQELANKHNKSVANIIVRWGIQRGIFMIPKSVTEKRITDNANVFDFTLGDEDMLIVDKLNRGKRYYPDPDNAPFAV